MEDSKGENAKVRIVLFAGGRGAGTIASALAAQSQIQLTLLANAYDDGLSTGRIRDFIPGMLGPSDIRKNFSRLIPNGSPASEALKFLLEYRLPDATTVDQAKELLSDLVDFGNDKSDNVINRRYNQLSLSCARSLSEFSALFLDYFNARSAEGITFDFGDCSLGNLFLAGAFLKSGRDFNRAVTAFAQLHSIPATILNVTRGECLALVGLKEDGTFLKREAEIVDRQNPSRIAQIFLLPDYLPSFQLKKMVGKSQTEKIAFLNSLSVTPELNPNAQRAIAEAHIIVYGPGTQHSSLFPSYLTRGIGEAIASNKISEKVFVANTRLDNEIQSETVDSLVEKLVDYMNRGNRRPLAAETLVTRCFLQSETESGNLPGGAPTGFKTIEFNWETTAGVHLGGKVAEEIISVVNERAKATVTPLPYMVSIIVPGLNEVKTVARVLNELRRLNTQAFGIAKEIIFVDGGSTDGTFESAQSVRDVHVFQPPHCRGRGHALRFGIEQARGNFVIFFPCDAEYDVLDLNLMISILMQNDFNAVFGSRAIKGDSMPRRIRRIYGKDYFGYLIGLYGGKLLSILCLILYNRFVADPLTGMKAFQRKLLDNLNLSSNSVDLETEIVAKLALRDNFILEVPINYFPRRRDQGKKIRLWDGILALFRLFSLRIANHENLDCYPGVQRKEDPGPATPEDLNCAA